MGRREEWRISDLKGVQPLKEGMGEREIRAGGWDLERGNGKGKGFTSQGCREMQDR